MTIHDDAWIVLSTGPEHRAQWMLVTVITIIIVAINRVKTIRSSHNVSQEIISFQKAQRNGLKRRKWDYVTEKGRVLKKEVL